MSDGFTPIFSPAGTGHRAGAVPDPGTNPDSYVLRADATWGPAPGSTDQAGSSLLTILAGNAAATGMAAFDPVYEAAPLLLVSSDNYELMPSIVSIGTTHAIVQMTAATPVITDTTGTISWLAV